MHRLYHLRQQDIHGEIQFYSFTYQDVINNPLALILNEVIKLVYLQHRMITTTSMEENGQSVTSVCTWKAPEERR